MNKEARKRYNRKYNKEHRDEIRVHSKKYKRENIDEIKEYTKKWYVENLEKIKKQQKEYYIKNREKILKQSKEWWIKNRRKMLIWMKKYGKKHRKKKREYMRKYRNLNSERYKIYNQIRYSRKKNGGVLTIQTIQRVYEDNIKKYGTLTCEYDRKPIQFGQDSLDHKIPLSRSGSNDYENLCVACRKCNREKHNKTDKEFKKLLI